MIQIIIEPFNPNFIINLKILITIKIITLYLTQRQMFVVQALYPFSSLILKQQLNQDHLDQITNRSNYQDTEKHQENYLNSQNYQTLKSQDQNYALQKLSKSQEAKIKSQDYPNQAYDAAQKQQETEISYLNFQKGDKILVLQSYDNGWWYGHTIKNPDLKGFFPSNYIQTSAKLKPPPPPPQQPESQDSQNQQDQEQKGIDWVQNQLKKITQGPVKSDYYLGIKGYKNVKIDDKNQNVLKGDHVKFDVSTGLAKVPIKDQAPVAKAIRQMGYYFDYHQWNQQRNKQPHQKARPDPKKKKIKKLKLKGMN